MKEGAVMPISHINGSLQLNRHNPRHCVSFHMPLLFFLSISIIWAGRGLSSKQCIDNGLVLAVWHLAYGLYVSPTLRLLFMKVFRIFKKKPQGHGQASDVPAASSTPDTSSHSIGAEILVQGVDPITAEWVPSSIRISAYRCTSLTSEQYRFCSRLARSP